MVDDVLNGRGPGARTLTNIRRGAAVGRRQTACRHPAIEAEANALNKPDCFAGGIITPGHDYRSFPRLRELKRITRQIRIHLAQQVRVDLYTITSIVSR